MALPPLTLYVHLPWCLRKCPYCDFNSHRAPQSLPEVEYRDALIADLALASRDIVGRPIEAIFFGGGTPSLFSTATFGAVIEAANRQLGLAADAEITIEANPGTIERGHFADYRGVGINRVSLGVQTFDDSQLKTLGRIHDSEAACRAIEELHAAGMDNFNIDLMFGLPGQDGAGAVRDIEQAIAAQPTHISHYELTLEPNTLFAVQPPSGMPDDDLQLDILAACAERLAASGFQRYEISAWSRPGQRSRHNLNYWTFGDYLGIGAGAHGKLSSDDGIWREARQRHPDQYLRAAGRTAVVQERRRLDPAAATFEFMLNASRLLDGVPDGLFEKRTGFSPDPLECGLAKAAAAGWLERDGRSGFRPTTAGINWLNDVQALFLPDAADADGPA